MKRTLERESRDDDFDRPRASVDKVTIHEQRVLIARKPRKGQEVQVVVELAFAKVSHRLALPRVFFVNAYRERRR